MRWKYGWNEKSVQTFFIPFFLTYVLTSNTYTHEDHRYYINFTFPLYRFSICVCVCSIPRPFRPLQKKILLKLQSFIHFYYTEGEKNWGNYFILWQIFQWNVYCVWAFLLSGVKQIFCQGFFSRFSNTSDRGKGKKLCFYFENFLNSIEKFPCSPEYFCFLFDKVYCISSSF